ncbi:MAG: glycoside hydrolase family 99-like domain-containing protein, partial [Ignavibacteria bacterium]
MSKPRILAFYLPQYYPIPENDEWWGKGFTDWINVAKGKPRFLGHHQPHLPSELGFYDLRLEETRIAQAKLAAEYGITGFCYHHYWFNSKILLEKPFNEVLQSGKPNFPFCLCWANENWTRRWDGLEQEILIEQDYEKYNPEQHIKWLEKAFSDKRYIRIDGKPLFLIYKTDSIPDLRNKVLAWRQIIRGKGYPDLYLGSVKSIHNKLSDAEVINLGFDAVVDFIPNNRDLPRRKALHLPKNSIYSLINKLIVSLRLEGKIKKLPVTFVYSYKAMVDKIIKKPKRNYKTFPCIIPGWDNSARRKYASVIQNDDTEIY